MANEISKRLISIFRKDINGNRPVNDYHERYKNDPHFRDLFYFMNIFMVILQEVLVRHIKPVGQAL